MWKNLKAEFNQIGALGEGIREEGESGIDETRTGSE